MKKLFAVILSIIMLFSSLPVLSFGASEVVPVSVTCKDSYPLSLKEIEQAGNTDRLSLMTSELDYEFEITLSDGRKFFAVNGLSLLPEDAEKFALDLGGGRVMIAFAHVDTEECRRIKEEGGNKVPVYIDVTVYKYNLGLSLSLSREEEYTLVTEKEIVSQLVTIEPVSGLPEYVYEGATGVNFENAVFELKYWDGTVKNVTPVYTDEIGREFYLDGKPAVSYYDEDEKEAIINFLDAELTVPIKDVLPCPIKEVKIADVTCNGNLEMTVAFDVIYNDGTIKSYAKTAEAKLLSGSYSYCGQIEGYNVIVGADTRIQGGEAAVSVGEIVGTKNFEIEYEGIYATFIGKIVLLFKAVIEKFKGVFYL